MKRMLMVVALGLVAGGQYALAADLPQAPAPMPRAPATYVPTVAPVYNWTGFYVGINGGGGFGDSDWTSIAPFTGSSGSFSTDGFLIGGTLGANFQANQFVFGVEGDGDYSTIKGNTPTTFCGTCQTRNDWLATVRGRIGFAADRVLLFGTGGVAFGDIKDSSAFGTDTTTKTGWTGGGGVEFALTDNLTAKVEYLYVDLGNGNCANACGTTATSANVKFTSNVIRAGLNFKFGP